MNIAALAKLFLFLTCAQLAFGLHTNWNNEGRGISTALDSKYEQSRSTWGDISARNLYIREISNGLVESYPGRNNLQDNDLIILKRTKVENSVALAVADLKESEAQPAHKACANADRNFKHCKGTLSQDDMARPSNFCNPCRGVIRADQALERWKARVRRLENRRLTPLLPKLRSDEVADTTLMTSSSPAFEDTPSTQQEQEPQFVQNLPSTEQAPSQAPAKQASHNTQQSEEPQYAPIGRLPYPPIERLPYLPPSEPRYGPIGRLPQPESIYKNSQSSPPQTKPAPGRNPPNRAQ